jgi:S-adenosylmethionine:tRNA ribosyltransferase-isomerase
MLISQKESNSIRQLEKTLEKYNYSVPPNLIAQKPAHPRDSAKLLVYDKKSKKVDFDNFINLDKYLPKNTVLVFNDTKVVPARLTVTKPTGGKARILYTETKNGLMEVMSDRKLDIGSRIILSPTINFLVKNQSGKYYHIKPSFPINRLFYVLNKYGKTPIPPYIKHSPLSESKLRQEYQTIFAKTKGSVAAPTASLHFTKRLFEKLKTAGIGVEFITLHVGLGTFAPLTEENLKTGKLHKEFYSINPITAKRLNQYKKERRPIIAVGTTAARTLESAVNNRLQITNLRSETKLFIQEGYKFKFIDGMITNFHVPKSSLMMLVSALVGRKNLLNLYKKAIAKKLRFFSFGDGMLIK